ncbi:hypothetical protein pmac_cds_624 [Pandoravirus macleodensis]|uniref:DUF2283 domain-containing protein n=1 Tax=Pandoravirus macleodensis TaxID=2107707 RepID=A0A2U7UFV9_9VIRU|nr:hypothetical protein pmac_cds_624 [Pandoravirus macleodensis]AVK77312.1 hypothetical protein pmac_cds_624 [Pandoravirus macleodensis]
MQTDNNTTACADTTEREAPWKDVEIHYDQDTDIVDIYVVHVTPGLITRTIPLDNDETDVLMGMDDEGRTIAIKFLDASSVFARRFFTKTVVLDASSREAPAACTFDASADKLFIPFVRDHYLGQRERALGNNVIALMDDDDRITAMWFAHASRTVLRADLLVGT